MSQSSLSIGFKILICLLHKFEQPSHLPTHTHTERNTEKRKKEFISCHLTPAAPAFKPLPHSHYMICCLLEELTC